MVTFPRPYRSIHRASITRTVAAALAVGIIALVTTGCGATSDTATAPDSMGDPATGPVSGATDTIETSAFDSVDPGEFQAEDGSAVIFASPSGNLECAIEGPAAGGLGYAAGCQAHSLVENLPECDDIDTNGPLVALTSAGAVEPGCTREGIFFREEDPAVLDYGQQVEFQNVTCRSAKEGISCSQPDGTGFSASRAEFAPLG